MTALYASDVDAAEASALSGVPLGRGGVLFPQGGWIRPPNLVAALLHACGDRLTRRFCASVQAIQRNGDEWSALAEEGTVIARAPVLVLCTAEASLAGQAHLLTNRVGGRVTHLGADALPDLRTVLLAEGFAIPALEGVVVTGATFEREGEAGLTPAQADGQNLARLGQIIGRAPDAATVTGGRAGWRLVTIDRLPIIGALPDEDRVLASAGAQLDQLPRQPGLYAALGYGSRGLLWSALGAEVLASLIDGGPMPIEAGLARAVDPARFALRAARTRRR
jgi:tRNA 5-methylaminomethyl-2-thiouridine biosynthesis bifunctional protein